MSVQFYREGYMAMAGRELPPNPIYVDTVKGSLNGSGTETSPVNSLATATAMCAGLPDSVIRVNAPASAPLRQQVTYESTMNLTIEGVGNTPWHIYGSELFTTGWSGNGPVYSRQLDWTTVAPVVIPSMNETILGKTLQLKLLPNTETPKTPSAGEYGYIDGALYVRLPGDVSPNAQRVEIGRRNTSLLTIGFGRLTIRDAVANYCIGGGIINGLFTQPTGTGLLTIEDSETSYNGGNGIGAAGRNVETIITRTKAYRNSNDGFNLHSPGGEVSYMQLNGCDGSYNGDFAGISAQGCSNHGNTIMDVNGGRYDGNVSGGMVVIDDATCNLHGDTKYGAITMDKNMRLGGDSNGTIAGQAGAAWLDNSTGNVTGSVTVSNGLGVGVRNAKPGSVNGIENIRSIGNAMPDQII